MKYAALNLEVEYFLFTTYTKLYYMTLNSRLNKYDFLNVNDAIIICPVKYVFKTSEITHVLCRMSSKHCNLSVLW